MARIPLTLSRYPSLSCFTPDRSARLHPVRAQECCVMFWANPSSRILRTTSVQTLNSHLTNRLCWSATLMFPCVGVHRRTSLMSSPLLHKQNRSCLVRLTWMVCEMGSKWPYNCRFLGCCLQGLFKTAGSILFEVFIKLFLISFLEFTGCNHTEVPT